VAMRALDDGIMTTKLVPDPEEFLRLAKVIDGRQRLAKVS